jgi:hypothetical protein
MSPCSPRPSSAHLSLDAHAPSCLRLIFRLLRGLGRSRLLIPCHGPTHGLLMWGRCSPKGVAIFAPVEQQGCVEFVEQLHRLAQHRIRQSQEPEQEARHCQRTGLHPGRFTGQGNVLPPCERRSRGQVPDLAQSLIVRPQRDQPACGTSSLPSQGTRRPATTALKNCSPTNEVRTPGP